MVENLPSLVPLHCLKPSNVQPWVNGWCKDAHGNYRRFQGRKECDPKNRAKTFPGIAKSIAEQWSAFITEQEKIGEKYESKL